MYFFLLKPASLSHPHRPLYTTSSKATSFVLIGGHLRRIDQGQSFRLQPCAHVCLCFYFWEIDFIIRATIVVTGEESIDWLQLNNQQRETTMGKNKPTTVPHLFNIFIFFQLYNSSVR